METRLYTLITGASSGIGREVAIRLSRGRNLILHGRSLERLGETRDLCENADQQLLWPMDLGDPGAIEAALREFLAKQELGIDCFVHCAGVMKILPMRQMEPTVARQLMNLNFFSAAEVIRLLLKKQINHGHLRNIVLVSSTASKFGAKGFSLYCASKGALDSLMRALAVELAPEIRVNSVLPGGVRTGMTESIFNDPQLADRLDAGYPLGRGEPSDIAAAVEFLVSDNSRWITGQQLIVDGGRTVNISA
jgi:NAD(P)-dependent dehydrogenase (short-subunit alcohol dehydrogenase family)